MCFNVSANCGWQELRCAVRELAVAAAANSGRIQTDADDDGDSIAPSAPPAENDGVGWPDAAAAGAGQTGQVATVSSGISSSVVHLGAVGESASRVETSASTSDQIETPLSGTQYSVVLKAHIGVYTYRSLVISV